MASCNSQNKGNYPDKIEKNINKRETDTVVIDPNSETKKRILSNKKNSKEKVFDSLMISITELKEKEGSDYINDTNLKKHIKKILNDSLSSFTKLKALDCNDTIVHFKGKDLKKNEYFVVLNRKKFSIEKHILKNKTFPVYLIDDKPFWGTDFGIPKKEFKYIEVYINQNETAFYKENYSDLYNPNFCSFGDSNVSSYEYINCLISKESDYLFIYMKGSDSGGAYNVIWIFKDKEYYSRVVELRV